MAIRTDMRSIDAEPAPAAREKAVGLFERSREVDLALAAALSEIEAKRAFALEGCASLGEWAGRFGFDPGRARDLASLGRAIEKEPALRREIETGEVSVVVACTAARLLDKPGLLKPGESVAEMAATLPLRELRHEVHSRLEAERQGTTDPLLPMNVFATDETWRTFWRARDLASKEAKRELSNSQAFAVITYEYVHRHDPLLVEARARRVGPTSERPNSRYVPATEKRALSARSGLRCEVPGCTFVATERCHVHPHVKRSGREVRDIWDGCHPHHVLYDAGILRIEGFDERGRPIFVNANGARFLARGGGRGPPG